MRWKVQTLHITTASRFWANLGQIRLLANKHMILISWYSMDVHALTSTKPGFVFVTVVCILIVPYGSYKRKWFGTLFVLHTTIILQSSYT